MMVWATFVAPFAAGQQAFAETNADKHLRDIVSAAGGHGAVRFFRGPVLSTLRRPPFPARDMVGRVGVGVGVGWACGSEFLVSPAIYDVRISPYICFLSRRCHIPDDLSPACPRRLSDRLFGRTKKSRTPSGLFMICLCLLLSPLRLRIRGNPGTRVRVYGYAHARRRISHVCRGTIDSAAVLPGSSVGAGGGLPCDRAG